MAVNEKYLPDVEAILSHRYDNGADYWTTPDNRLLKGSPFSLVDCVLYLLELGMDSAEPVLKESIDLLFSTWQPDGRFKLYPKGEVFPCQTVIAARALCLAGYAGDERVQTTLRYLLDTRWDDGAWRCNKFFFGRGPETEHSNPNPTMLALDAFRLAGMANVDRSLDEAVEFLLGHWETRAPLGPCHYGIGTLFMQVEYPFRNYNLFQYVYTLSFYEKARGDARFLEAFQTLKAKTVDGQIVVERVVPKLAKLGFCKKGQPSELATKRYQEILDNDTQHRYA